MRRRLDIFDKMCLLLVTMGIGYILLHAVFALLLGGLGL